MLDHMTTDMMIYYRLSEHQMKMILNTKTQIENRFQLTYY